MLEVNTETSSLTIGFFSLKLWHFVHFHPKGSFAGMETFLLCSWRNDNMMGFWRLWRAAVITHRAKLLWATSLAFWQQSPHAAHAGFLLLPQTFGFLSASPWGEEHFLQTSVPGPEQHILSSSGPSRSKATSILTRASPLIIVELLQFHGNVNKYIKALRFLGSIHTQRLDPCTIHLVFLFQVSHTYFMCAEISRASRYFTVCLPCCWFPLLLLHWCSLTDFLSSTISSLPH